MHTSSKLSAAMTIVLAVLAGCGDRQAASENTVNGLRQTAFPGQMTAGGGSSGAVMARTARPESNATYAGGTPGIAGGSGGNTGGAATAGTVTEAGQGPSSGTSRIDAAAPGVAAPEPANAPPPVGVSPRGGTAPTSGDIPTAGGETPAGPEKR